MNYQFTRVVSDSGFFRIIPKIEFYTAFNQEYQVVYETQEAFYKVDELFDLIEKELKEKDHEYQKKEYFNYVNKNKDLVANEVVYIDHTNNTLLAFKSEIDDTNCYPLPQIGDVDDLEIPMDNKNFNKLQYGITIEAYGLLDSKKYLEGFLKKIISSSNEETKRERELNIICKGEYGLILKSFATNGNKIDINTHYNSDFKEASERIIDKLNAQDSNGIVLLSGLKGTGKTSYLRYLTTQITTKRLIYIPPDMTASLSEPEFISFIMPYANSILIIEDAENVLKPRKAGGSQAISNLLNLSDGLLGDALKIQVLCTFNCDIKEIDDALLRPGRLIAEYKFEKLSISKSNDLLKSLYGNEEEIVVSKPMTLAEIYNYKEKMIISSNLEGTIGFKK